MPATEPNRSGFMPVPDDKSRKSVLNILMVYLITTTKCKISSLHIILIIHTHERLLDLAG